MYWVSPREGWKKIDECNQPENGMFKFCICPADQLDVLSAWSNTVLTRDFISLSVSTPSNDTPRACIVWNVSTMFMLSMLFVLPVAILLNIKLLAGFWKSRNYLKTRSPLLFSSAWEYISLYFCFAKHQRRKSGNYTSQKNLRKLWGGGWGWMLK